MQRFRFTLTDVYNEKNSYAIDVPMHGMEVEAKEYLDYLLACATILHEKHPELTPNASWK